MFLGVLGCLLGFAMLILSIMLMCVYGLSWLLASVRTRDGGIPQGCPLSVNSWLFLVLSVVYGVDTI